MYIYIPTTFFHILYGEAFTKTSTLFYASYIYVVQMESKINCKSQYEA